MGGSLGRHPGAAIAAMKADSYLGSGDMEGRVIWLRIIAAIKELEAREPEVAIH